MCELLGMSASYEVDLDTSLSLLRPRGGEICANADGWGVAHYEGNAARVLKEAKPASRSPLFAALRSRDFASHTVLAHVRKANPTAIGRQFSNTHPFERELSGRSWVFAHNGRLPGIEDQPLIGFRPIGATDSEHAFCTLLDTARDYLSEDGAITDVGLMLGRLARKVSTINEYGEFNFLLSNGEDLIVHAHTYLHAVERQCRVEENEQTVVLIATHPLTDDEAWACLLPNSLSIFRNGKLIAQQSTDGQASDDAWQRQRCEAEVVTQLRHEAEARWMKLRPDLDDGMYYESG